MGKLLQKSKVKAKKRHVNSSKQCQSEINILKVQLKELKKEKDNLNYHLFVLFELLEHITEHVKRNANNLNPMEGNNIHKTFEWSDLEEKDEMFWTIEQNTWY